MKQIQPAQRMKIEIDHKESNLCLGMIDRQGYQQKKVLEINENQYLEAKFVQILANINMLQRCNWVLFKQQRTKNMPSKELHIEIKRKFKKQKQNTKPKVNTCLHSLDTTILFVIVLFS